MKINDLNEESAIKSKGCELCGDWPVVLAARCHPTAPLRIELEDDGTLTCFCYVPECRRKVLSIKLTIDQLVEVGIRSG